MAVLRGASLLSVGLETRGAVSSHRIEILSALRQSLPGKPTAYRTSLRDRFGAVSLRDLHLQCAASCRYRRVHNRLRPFYAPRSLAPAGHPQVAPDRRQSVADEAIRASRSEDLHWTNALRVARGPSTIAPAWERVQLTRSGVVALTPCPAMCVSS